MCLMDLGVSQESTRLRLDSAEKPVQHQPRGVPISQKSEVKSDIDRSVKKGVLEKVTKPTDWISSMVVVKKPTK